jgi:hypothetical protein
MTNEETLLQQIEELKKQNEEKDNHIIALQNHIEAGHSDSIGIHSFTVTQQDAENVLGVLDEARGIIGNMLGVDELSVEQRRSYAAVAVGLRRAGFIDNITSIIESNLQFAPREFNMASFKLDVLVFDIIRNCTIMATQILRMLMDLQLSLGARIYRSGLEYYAGVKVAAHNNRQGAHELLRRLGVFFNNFGRGHHKEDPTEMEILRDFKALEHGRKDGEIIIRNEGDKIVKGGKVVIDTAHKQTGAFKETEHGKID